MRATQVVVVPPSFVLALRIIERQELIGVETLIAQFAVERFDVPVFRGFPGVDEVEGSGASAEISWTR